jgi:phosphate starvation-inducible PhoH-like protein
MSKKQRRQQSQTGPIVELSEFHPKNEKQRRYLNSMKANTITFGLGAAGTGKTYCAAHYAAQLLFNNHIDRLIVTRPAQEAGEEELGFLPGDLAEKFAPYLAPIRENLEHALGKSFVDYLVKIGRIEYIPIGFMRGRSFDNCLIIADEAQNMTRGAIKMLMTRIGKNTKLIIDGDERQTDIGSQSGLMDAVARTKHINGVDVIEFDVDDIVRSDIVGHIIRAYDK